MAIVQVTIVLREKLEEIGVEVSVETFEEHQGTAALGEDPFVSCTMVHVVNELIASCCTPEACLTRGAVSNNDGELYT